MRFAGRHATKTFASKAAAESWARSQETAIESGEFRRPAVGVIFSDLVDALLEHRKVIRRPLGKTAARSLENLKTQLGLEPVDALTEEFWRRHALARMAGVKGINGGKPVTSQSAAQDLLYASAIVRFVRFALATAMRRGEIITIAHEDISDRVILVRNRKHPRDHERVDEVPLLQRHLQWPLDDPLEIIERQPTKAGRIFPYHDDTIGFGSSRPWKARSSRATSSFTCCATRR